MEELDSLFTPHLRVSLLDELAHGERLAETEIAQPTLFAMQIALTRQWAEWGVCPSAVAGHSLGEVTAGVVAGALSLAEGVRLVAIRGKLMQSVTGKGKMVAVNLPANSVATYLAGENGVAIAAINTPDSCVVAGEVATLERLMGVWENAGIHARILPVNYAFHSPQVTPLAQPLMAQLERLQPTSGKLPIYSTVTGEKIAGDSLTAHYWGENLTKPVTFAPTIQSCMEDGYRTFLEIAPHPVLYHYLEGMVGEVGEPGLVAYSLRRKRDERVTLLANAGKLYAHGFDLDWGALVGERGRFTRLPTYPWQRRSYWIDVPATVGTTGVNAGNHPLLERQIRSPVIDGLLFETKFSPQSPRFQGDHRIHGVLVVPATAYLEMVSAGSKNLFGEGHHAIRQMVVRDALIIPDQGEMRLQLVFSDVTEQSATWQIFATGETTEDWRVYASGRVEKGANVLPSTQFEREAMLVNLPEQMNGTAYYEQGRGMGGDLGVRFNSIQQIWRREGEAVGKLHFAPELGGERHGYLLQPAFADSLFHIAYATQPAELATAGALMPVGFDRVIYYGVPGAESWVHFLLRSDLHDPTTLVGDVRLYSESGVLLAEADGVRYLRATGQVALLGSARRQVADWFYEVRWHEKGLPASSHINSIQKWLIVPDEMGIGEALAERLGGRLVDSADELTEALQGVGGNAGILYLRALDKDGGDVGGEALGWVQEMLRAGVPAKIWFVSCMGQTVNTSDQTNPLQAILWGLGRTLSNEHADYFGGLIDLPALEIDSAINILTNELQNDDGELEVAWRDGKRLVARLIKTTQKSPSHESALPDGTFVVTGGFGGIGRRVTDWLVERGATHLALLSRRGATEADMPFVAQLAEAGTKVTAFAVDVADKVALKQVWGEIESEMPAVAGIFHTAGVVADSTLLTMTPEQWQAPFSAKLAGTKNLHALSQRQPIEYFVLFSSGAAILGSPGQANYASANSFMDAFAHYRQGLGLPALSINWGAWADAGMAMAVGEAGTKRWQAFGMGQISPMQGIAALERALIENMTQVAVLPLNLKALSSQMISRLGQRPFFAELLAGLAMPAKTDAPIAGIRAELAGLPAKRRQNALFDYLILQTREALGWGADYEIDPAQGFFDIGVDSLTAVELKEKIERDLGVSLPATLIFDYPTPVDLTTYLGTLLWEKEEQVDVPATDDLEALSEDELLALLEAELDE